jgi:hypothetical protein
MRFELGLAAPAAGLWGKASPRPKSIHQVDDKGNRHPEMRRGRVARMTFIDKADNALTQIKRIRLQITNHLLSEANLPPPKILLIPAF